MHAAHTGALDVDALSNENIEVLRQELLVPVDCSKLGEHAVVVKDVPGFIKRVEAAVKAKGYEGRCGLVKYYNLELEADHRRHAEVENAIRDLKYGVGLNHMPSGRFAANGAWLAIQVMAHNLARWTARTGLGEQVVRLRLLLAYGLSSRRHVTR